MSTTTGADLLARADRLTRQLRASEVPVSREQWERFDVTLHRLLHEIVGPGAAHVRLHDPARAALATVSSAYPSPLRPPAPRPLRPTEAARQLARTDGWVRRQIRHGNLHVVRDGRDTYLPATEVDTRTDITPADPTDPHPLARLATTLGALADLAHEAGTSEHLLLPGDGEAAGAAVHVLALGAVAARHALIHSPIADADRPLAIAQYAERAIDALRDCAHRPAGLDRLTAVTPHRGSDHLNDRLEAAVYDWGQAGRGEMNRLIPSVDVLRAFANQGTHLYAVTLQLLQASPAADVAPTDLQKTTEAITTAAGKMRQADHAWARLTTAARPTHEFVTASRTLFQTLQEVTTTLDAAPTGLEIERAIRDLAHGAEQLAELAAATQTLPNRLIESQLLFAPATVLKASLAKLDSRNKGRLVDVGAADVPDLPHHWHRASQAAQEAARALHLTGRDPTARTHPLDRDLEHPLP